MALKQPRSLSDLASCTVGTIIGQQALFVTKKINSEIKSSAKKIDLELNIKKLAEFYDVTLPQTLHNVVTYHTLKHIADKNFDNTQYDLNIFDLVLRCHVTKFNFQDWPFEMHYMLYMNLPKLKDLKFLYLHLDCTKNKNENLKYILKGIEGMKHLETFKCDNCNDDIVRVLCDNCPLKNLKLCYVGCGDKDVLIQSVLKLQNLEMLNIKASFISKEELKQLLFGLPHLKTFENFQLQFLLPEISDEHVTSLQNIRYHCSNQSHVTNLTKLCPLIRKLDLSVEYDKSIELSNLAKLKYITCLQVCCDFYKSNVLTVIHIRGYQLTELDIYCYMISVSTLHFIDISCPNLIKLALGCYMDEKTEFPTNNRRSFQKLESFSNCGIYHPNDPTPYLIFFLHNCMQIKEVKFITASNLCDADIDDILTCNPLANLRKLFIEEHKLTVKSIYKFLTSCKQLRWLGYTSSWKTVTISEVAELHNYVRRNNLNVEFVNDDNVFNLML